MAFVSNLIRAIKKYFSKIKNITAFIFHGVIAVNISKSD